MRKPKIVELNLEDRAELERWSEDPTLPARQRRRARVLLLADTGWDDTAIAVELHICRQTCMNIRKRFLAKGVQVFAKDQPRRGRPPRIKAETIITLTTCWPPAPATDWSRALMAHEIGVSASAVGRIWQRNGLNPQGVARFKVINDPRMAEKLEAVVGLYLAPLQRTLVLCVNEKIEIQAPARTQPGLPLRQGRRRTLIHGSERQRQRTLIAGINTVEATVLSTCQAQSRHQEWLDFLQQIDRQTPADRRLYVVMNDLATDRPQNVYGWLDNHPRIRMRITTTSDFWLKVVERFFRVLTTRQQRDGMTYSVTQLQAAIWEYMAAPKDVPKPFSWTAKVADFRAKAALDKLQS